MITVSTNQEVKLKLSVMRAGSDNKEKFNNALLKVFLCTPDDKISCDYTLENETDVKVNLGKLTKVGRYHVQMVWVRNHEQRRGLEVGDCLARAEVQEIFAVTNVQSEASDPSLATVTINAKTYATTYGQDGLNVYELSVLRGVWSGTEKEYVSAADLIKFDLGTVTTGTVLPATAKVFYVKWGDAVLTPHVVDWYTSDYALHKTFCVLHYGGQDKGFSYYDFTFDETGKVFKCTGLYNQSNVTSDILKAFGEDLRGLIAGKEDKSYTVDITCYSVGQPVELDQTAAIYEAVKAAFSQKRVLFHVVTTGVVATGACDKIGSGTDDVYSMHTYYMDGSNATHLYVEMWRASGKTMVAVHKLR